MKIHIQNNIATGSVDMWIIDDSCCQYPNNGKRAIAKAIKFEFEAIDPDEFKPVEPTLRFSNLVAQEFLSALAEALDKHGVKTENDFKMRGLLEAKEAHLQDMRQLVFGEEKK